MTPETLFQGVYMQDASLTLVMVAAAIILRGWGTVSYLLAIRRLAGTPQRVEPSLVSWSLWTTAQLAAFFAQWAEQDTVSAQAFITLCLGLGSGMVVVVAIAKNSFKLGFTWFERVCLAFAVTGILGGIALKSPALVLACSICADLAAGLPTVIKAWKKPASEHRATYFCSLLAAIATLLTIRDWAFVAGALPVYFVIVNVAMVSILTFRRGQKHESKPAQANPVLVE